ncbi:MAG TPA: hypothetical protein VM576_10720 [Xanthomonadaceae bacterium]|jgi:hypothetical protein|nr:hypothetical protein [Xanthomonadaceae bacterium]
MSFRPLLLALPLLLLAGAACAADGAKQPLSDCTDIAPQHEAFRFGTQYLFVKDGDAHYRLSFGSGCGALTTATQVTVQTDGQANRLCPKNTRVETRSGICSARQIDLISAESYARYQRKAR